MFISKNGSVATVTSDGDIISVCANKSTRPTDNSKGLLEYAVREGGVKLDSFDGNYGFYRHCGFEPVSWCDFVEEFAPTGWKKSYKKERIIFFKYTGKQSKYKKKDDFYTAVKPSKDYDAAKYKRDKELN